MYMVCSGLVAVVSGYEFLHLWQASSEAGTSTASGPNSPEDTIYT
jgi:hypothetical protein